MKFNHPLMTDNISKGDRYAAIRLLKTNHILTQSTNVKKFENQWSKWLGTKYSVFVNSGSSANYITILSLKILFGNKGEIIVPALTWISDIASVIQNNFKIKFVDINLKNLSMDENHLLRQINKNTKAIFLTHAQGFNGLSDKILKTIKKKR